MGFYKYLFESGTNEAQVCHSAFLYMAACYMR